MALFGKKKRSLEEIAQDIEALSEEEKNELLSKMQSKPENVEKTAEESAPAVEEENKETVANEETPTEETATAVEETAVSAEDTVETVETAPETPLETPQPEEKTGGNYDELIAAQNARMDSLESIITGLKETVEKVVANQDNKNFGYSPKANFDDDVQTSRSDAILQGYAPKRAEQYK